MDKLKRIRIKKWIELGIAGMGFLIGIGLGLWIMVKMVLLGISK